jgi:chromosomal replication initiation ATPase DnaA
MPIVMNEDTEKRIEYAIKCASEAFHVVRGDMLRSNRKLMPKFARFTAIYLACGTMEKRKYEVSCMSVANYIGKQNHATVVNAIVKVSQWVEYKDPAFYHFFLDAYDKFTKEYPRGFTCTDE